MISRSFSILGFICISFLALTDMMYAWGILPDASSGIKGVSITLDQGTSNPSDLIEISRSIGMRFLSAIKVVVSGFALIYLVIVWVYMIIFSENEERVKTQRMQLSYALVGFLFLNIPGVVYQIFFWDIVGRSSGKDVIWTGDSILFWDEAALTGLNGIIPMMLGFLEIFIFWVAILTFTWGLFRLVMSGGDEEQQKTAKNRIIYGSLGLVFLGFVKFWGSIIAQGDFQWEFATVGNKLLWLALYFAVPIAIFFIVIGAYYYITSAWDEERIKKWKTILINTFIASLILLASYSFFSDIVSFRL